MKVLVACEFSGVVREAFRKRGHDAWSCDLQPSLDSSKYHIQDDVTKHLDTDWDLLIAHPPCTYFTNAGALWYYHPKYKNRSLLRDSALEFVHTLFNSRIKRKAIENPVGTLSTLWRKPDQIVQPFWFGDPVSKATCLWTENLPLLKKTNEVPVEYITTSKGRRFTKWFYESSLLPLKERSNFRSKTFQGIADAMAEQWGA